MTDPTLAMLMKKGSSQIPDWAKKCREVKWLLELIEGAVEKHPRDCDKVDEYIWEAILDRIRDELVVERALWE